MNAEGQPGTCWGLTAPRLKRSAAYWRHPYKWNQAAAAAQAAGLEVNRRRVFCASMADVFEVQGEASRAWAGKTGQVPSKPGQMRTVHFVDINIERVRLLRVIYDTPHLDWLCLTKRPENILPALTQAQVTTAETDPELAAWLEAWINGQPPLNVWLGTSVEDQANGDRRIRELRAVPAVVHFLSLEPLLGPVQLEEHLTAAVSPKLAAISWLIVGGESGHEARPLGLDWAESLLTQGQAAGVPVLMKQLGARQAKALGCSDKAGTIQAEMPAALRLHQSPASRW